jgi:hypothetical protein
VSSKILEGILESIGPGQVQGGWTIAKYIDIGGRRVSNIAYSNELGYHLEKGLGKRLRLAVQGDKRGGLVAAVEGEAGVVKEVKRRPVDIAFLFQMFPVWCLAIVGSMVVKMFLRGDILAYSLVNGPALLLLLPFVAITIISRSGFEAAKSKLDKG